MNYENKYLQKINTEIYEMLSNVLSNYGSNSHNNKRIMDRSKES